MPTVHILGGGPAALAAAFDLAQDPTRQVVIHTAGWRLGGKCASGMGVDGGRNEEHGLHMPLGWYENFFFQIRAIYNSLGRPAGDPFETWEHAFRRRSEVILRQQVAGQWFDWPMVFTDWTNITAPLPGDMAHACQNGDPFDLIDLVDVAETILDRVFEYTRDHLVDAGLPGGALPGAMFFADAIENLGALIGVLGGQPNAATQFERFKTKVYIELGTAAARGLMALHLSGRDLKDIDHLDFLEWLDQYAFMGALSDDVRTSAPIKMAYELVFAYENGDPTRGRLAAGVALRGIIRMLFGYQGAFGYDLAAGMGETVITPYYEILSGLPNVTINFFSRVVDVHLLNGRVASFDVMKQATTPGGASYAPLVPGTRQWPSRPLYGQLVEGAQLQTSLELPDGGYDLESSYSAWPGVGAVENIPVALTDSVLLAIPAPELEGMTSELAAVSPAWQAMLDNVSGVSTIAAQFWLNGTTAQLGWARPAGLLDVPLIGGAMQDPLGNIADTSRLLAHESWGAGGPQGLLYLCGPFREAEPPPPAGQAAPAYTAFTRVAARAQARTWVEDEGSQLFSNLVDNAGNLDPSVLYLPAINAMGTNDPFQWQFVNANVGPAHRYITSFPDTIAMRLPPTGPGALGIANNLFLAGDWTDNGFNGGCLEAAVTSGRMAARSIMGANYMLYGEDDEHW